MRCSKSGNLLCREMKLGQEELEQINRLTRREFQEEELYCFRVVLCDNEVDREWEQFDEQTLEELAGLFVGKTGICDHEAVSRNQQARIYEARVEREEGRTNLLGQPYCALVAKAYMVRTERNRDLILEIEAGIKKEVSVGCSVQGGRCSICGRERGQHGCEHIPGEVYDGRLCCTVLHGAADAYEWSFVAVPAQRAAGVVKKFSPRFEESEKKKEVKTVYDIVKKLADGEDSVTVAKEELNMLKTELKALFDRAECGDRYRAALCERIYKLSAVAQPEFKRGLTEAITKSLGIAELEEMAAALAKAAERKMPVMPQLAAEKTEDTNAADDGAFRI